LQIPPFLTELFRRCAEVSKQGVIPLRACLIRVAAGYNQRGLKGEYAISFRAKRNLQKKSSSLKNIITIKRYTSLPEKTLVPTLTAGLAQR
jgi:hypothetical protein